MRPIPSLSRKLVSVSSAALATALLSHAPMAHAQSFQGNPTAVFGTVDINTGPGATTIDVNSTSAVINWLPTDNPATGQPHNFQPVGTTATFRGTAGSGANFSVLNRIIPADPSRPIQFNGTVISNLQISVTTDPGGNIFFYSPGGIILGATANFDVGSLALTTLDLEYNSSTGDFNTGESFVFNPLFSSVINPLVPGSEVRILPGATIDTTTSRSYVALVAPRVYNGGTITGDGSVALVAADSASITFAPNGLFSISVDEGTSATGTVVENVGAITGPAGADRNIFMVAVAKNDAITMAIASGSRLGFDFAGAANVSGDAVILSAGYNVIDGALDTLPPVGLGTGQVSVTGSDANIKSNFIAQATGGVNLGSVAATGLNFASDVSIIASGANSSLSANGTGVLNVAGNLEIIGDRGAGIGPVVGNNVSILTDAGGVANLNGNVTLSSQGFGSSTLIPGGTGETGVGGEATIQAGNGGQITIQGDLVVNASGLGGGVQASSGDGGTGLGGTISILATGSSGASVQILGDLDLTAGGTGGNASNCAACLPGGGNATGGNVTISALGAHTITVGGSMQVNANGRGGTSNTGQSGSGTGGQIDISALNGGTLAFHSTLLEANGIGVGTLPFGGQGGQGTGGDINVSASGTGTGSVTFNADFLANTDGFGGVNPNLPGLITAGTGGTITIGARDGQTLVFDGALNATSNGLGGSAISGASRGEGGLVTLDAQSGGSVTVALNTSLTANGTGGLTSIPSVQTISSGGTAEITLGGGGSIQLDGIVNVRANGVGSNLNGQGQAADGLGGTARVSSSGGGVFAAGSALSLTATGTGGRHFDSPLAVVQGGNGTGGTASFIFTGGIATIASDLQLDASGIAGAGGLSGAPTLGGVGTGGIAELGAGTALALGAGSAITVDLATTITADGIGGDGFDAGAGIGGEVNISAQQGNLDLTSVLATSRGTGGLGMVGGSGGAATGGTINVVAYSSNAGPGEISSADLFINASADGGHVIFSNSNLVPGGAGGLAQGGTVLVAGSAGNGALEVTGSTQINAGATGGDGGNGNETAGGNGGNAFGGSIRVGLISGTPTGATNLGAASFNAITTNASAAGGAGGFGATGFPGAVGGNGGNASGGTATLVVEGSIVTIAGLGEWRTDALGGDAGFGDADGAGGNAVIGSANPALAAGSSAFIKNRLNEPTQRGVLDAASLIFTSTAVGGNGGTIGTATKAGHGTAFLIENGSIEADGITLVSLASAGASPTIVDPVVMTNSTATISGLFQQTTSSAISLSLSQSTLTALAVNMNAANWVLDPVVPATLGTLTGTSSINLVSGQNLLAHANLATQSGLLLNAIGRIDLGSIVAGGLVDVTAGTTLSLDNVTAGGLELSASGIIEVGNVTVDHSIIAESLANITTGNLVAGTGVPTGSNGDLNSVGLRSGGSVATGTIFAASSLGILAANAISTGEASAYDMLLLGGGSVSTGGLNAVNRVLIANAAMEAAGGPQGSFNPDLVFSATPVAPAAGPITISGPVSARSFSAATQGAFTSGTITVLASTTGSGNLLVNAGGALTATDLTARNSLALSAGGAVSTGALVSNLQGVTVNALSGSITTGAISARNDVTLGAAQALTVNGNIGARSVFGTSGANARVGEIASNGAISLSALGTLDVARANAARDIRLQSVGNLVTGDLAAGGGGTPTGANGEFNSINLRSDGSITTRVLFARSNLNVFANGPISTQQATAYDMLLLGGGSVSTTRLNASNRVFIANRSMEAIGQLASGFDANLVFASPAVATVGSISAGAVSATEFTAATRGDFTSQSITVLPSATGSGNLLVTADGALNAANLVAANRLNLVAGGALRTAALRSDTQGVKVATLGGSAQTGAITARNDVLVSTPQALAVFGPINARDVVLLAGGNVSTGAISAGAPSASAINPAPSTNPTGRVLIANNSLAAESFLRSASVDYAALLAASPVRTGGTVNVGAVSAGRFVSYSQGAMTGAAITTSALLDVETGGRVNIAQRWVSPLANIASADIRIIDNGSLTDAAGRPVLSGLHSTPTGSIRLVSIGGGQTLIGDGLTGTGYALSAAEFGLISTGNLAIGASSSTAGSAGMRIGNLALTVGGSLGQAIVAGPNGRILFATGNRDTQTVGGSIRITGNVTGSGFAGSNVLEFATGRFEIDAATGSLALTQTGTALGGTVEIGAANIHIASGAILDRLAADPFYAGHVADLNNAAAVSRPEGVLRALGLDLFPTGTLYIQNTGTFLDPAGFFADFEFTDVTQPANTAPASIAVIVNGKWQTPAGIVGGIAARDLVVDNANALAFYTPSSTVNGCAINAASCTATQELLDPTPAITGQIAVVSNNVLGNTPQFTPEPASSASVASGEGAKATEEAKEEAEAAAAAAITSESATSPIAPPPQMINSAPLEQKPPIDQPVAGSGNPSLIGSAVNENSAEGTAQ